MTSEKKCLVVIFQFKYKSIALYFLSNLYKICPSNIVTYIWVDLKIVGDIKQFRPYRSYDDALPQSLDLIL